MNCQTAILFFLFLGDENGDNGSQDKHRKYDGHNIKLGHTTIAF
ncbi:MAG TPA: hypothetical protein PKC38_01900 [Chitinophagales bacterium]|nr:hypothetical protein [Chitinophagales bacterium]